ncbi:hypothetical protein [Pseudoruegeria sp. SHC-113]|uniref:hypothetical protein n=1 Tax=Pseudoruegeria sp. SHC-113 TaxID=2855439 RepID=UPI0021BA55A0|nr:hypothetical protein [Pseudoruegeria sp. SHC-113]MCT8159535.1 hypothetical protein [Pseudoruegeria sp. SHC-113]
METRAEYEDVLSSIRRLVSEEVRSRAPLADVKSDSKPEPRESRASATVEKLVLTPAQRISPAPSHETEAPRAASPSEPLLLRPVDAPQEHVSKASEATPQLAGEEDPFASFEEVFGSDEWPRAPLADSRLASLERTIAELEAVVGDQGHVYEPDGSEEEGSSPEVEPLRVVPTRARAADPESEPEIAVAAEPEAPADVEESHGELPSFLRSAPEAGHHAPDTEPAFEPVSDSAQEEPVAESIAEGGDEVEPDADVFTSMAEDEDAVLLDEETLRQMVRDLVREELQGVLGERITRNVRKLVRTEIHRIVASQDFD